MHTLILKLLTFFFKNGSRIAPQLSARAALRLFCTPLKPGKASKQRKALEQSGLELFSKAERRRVLYEGGSIVAYRFKTQEPVSGNDHTVLLVHGWESQALHLAGFIPPLLQSGLNVIAVDLPGHGESSGSTFHVPLGVKSLHALHEQTGPWSAMVSHSLGGLVLSTALDGTLPSLAPLKSNALVMISAPANAQDLFDDFCGQMQLSEKSQQHFMYLIQQLAKTDPARFNITEHLANNPIPTLLLHAPDDKEIAYSCALDNSRHNAHVELQELAGLGHRRIIYSDLTIEKTVAFVSEHYKGALSD